MKVTWAQVFVYHNYWQLNIEIHVKGTYAIPGTPFLKSTMIFTIDPPLSAIHSLYAINQ